MFTSHPDVHASPAFLLSGPRHDLATTGLHRSLPSGSVVTLAERAAQFFSQHPDGLRLLVGAIPYARQGLDALYQPRIRIASPRFSAEKLLNVTGPVIAEPTGRQYRDAVATAVRHIQQGAYEKIVLSRSLKLSGIPTDALPSILSRLQRDALATLFATPLPTAPGSSRHLLGATPELLLHKQGRQVTSHPLAGSARRQADPTEDQAAGARLLASDKDRREHALAAEMVLDALAPYCDQLQAPQGMALTATAQMWHLGTRIEGRLRDPDVSCAELLAVLHPTPAVCGMPRALADAAIPDLEGYDRGFYAGAVGWLEENGDGCWYLALRCADLQDDQARLYAGAGIVAGSDPAAEEDETSAKFLAMLATFGITESGAALS